MAQLKGSSRLGEFGVVGRKHTSRCKSTLESQKVTAHTNTQKKTTAKALVMRGYHARCQLCCVLLGCLLGKEKTVRVMLKVQVQVLLCNASISSKAIHLNNCTAGFLV